MFGHVKLAALTGAVALVLAACGSTETTVEAPLDDAGRPPAAGACLAEDPECEDMFPGSDEPAEPPPPGLPITGVAATPIDGGFVISGFYLADESGVRLCELLAESLPPQCGGGSIAFENTAGADLGELATAQGVTWSDQPVLVAGEVIDGVFVAR